MENEIIDNSLNEYYNIDYGKQNLNINPKYLNWEESTIHKHGKNTKFIECKKDNIIFHCSSESLKEYPIYQSNCPICNDPICYFCSRYVEDSITNGECCIKRRIACMFLQDGFRFIQPVGQDVRTFLDYNLAFYFFLVPFINLHMFIILIEFSFFYDLKLKGVEHSETSYFANLRKNCFIFGLFFGINIVLNISLCICYFLLYAYFNVLLLVISVIFKNYLHKYYIGLTYMYAP